MTQAEWDALKADQSTEKYATIARLEDEQYATSCETLRSKRLDQQQPLLGGKPVYSDRWHAKQEN
ncbi:unnamed protein product [Alternaria alternata]